MHLRIIDFMSFTKFIDNLIKILTIICLILAVYFSFLIAPTDYEQFENYRIIYVHVPSAWICLLLYAIISFLSIIYLVYRNPIFIYSSINIAYIGSIFTFITLVTGSLWGSLTWGTYWVWDARLTSVLILFLLYISYIIIYYNGTRNRNIYCSIIAIIGTISLPIIKYSVNWWKTLHQPSSIHVNTSINTIHPVMYYPILVSFAFLLLYTIYLYLVNLRKDILINKNKRLI